MIHVAGGVNEVANTHAFLADLADFVLRTSNILLMPPISRFPVEWVTKSKSGNLLRRLQNCLNRFAPQVQINIMVISDRLSQSPSTFRLPPGNLLQNVKCCRKLTHQEQLAYSSSPRWEAFNRELKQLATNSQVWVFQWRMWSIISQPFLLQSVRVRWHHTSFADCVKCALSYSQSLRSYSRFDSQK